MTHDETEKWRFDLRSFWIGLFVQAIAGPIVAHVLHIPQLVEWMMS